MAYGTPGSLEDVEPYYTHIRRGRPPSAEQLADLVGRYERVGGVSPLREITFEQARKVEARLRERGIDAKTYVGMKHWHPSIAGAVDEMAADGVERAVGLVLAPHYSRMSVGQYLADAEEERAKAAPGMALAYVEHWGLNETFVAELASRVADGLRGWDPEKTMVLLTAHSLPARILAQGDPYARELLETAEAVAARACLPHWRFAYQSASATGEPWLGPDVLVAADEAAATGAYAGVIACPVGFVADHLEVLFDLDVELAERCAELGLGFRRTPSLNSDDPLIETLTSEIVAAMR